VGKPAVTHWRRLHRYALATRVEVRLETGRTHQIRIHFAAAGHPVVGERVYRSPRAPRFPIDFARLALHAGELAFDHPSDGRRVVVRSPPPADYAALLEKLERRRAPAGDRR
jgi:23S rRNA pseudouridine1911/1915/1917 synthase